jgi:DNA-directed RNA polymerase subunit beta
MPDLIPIMTGPEQKRAAIRQKVLEGLRESFPVKSRNKLLEIKDLKFQDKDYSPMDQKSALLRGDTLHEAVKGTLRLKDSEGKVIDELKNFTLARIPWFTPRHTFIVGGNEYSVSNMVRPKPGVYARKRANEILEANFNIVGGQNFNITMDPEKGEPQLEYGSSKIPLYTILRKAGVSHERIAKIWGRKLAEQNHEKLSRNASKHVDKLYNKMIPVYRQKAGADTSDKINEIFTRYSDTYMDPDVTEATLGKRYSSVSQDSLLDASGKVLRIFKQDAEVDDRDNLDFKTIHGVEDFFKERIKLDARDVARKTAIKMEAVPELKKALASGPFTKGILKFINSSQLASVPTQTNPMELIDAAMRVTSLGEGGISSERAIPMEARYTHPTQIGALDPIRTPESFRAGVDVRAAMMVKRDHQGNIYVPVYDVKKRKPRYIRAGEIQRKVLAFPGQELKGSVEALDKGQVRTLPASQVDYQIPHVSAMYSPTTNLVPFLESSQGNRAIMGSKMSTQALSLIDREAPLVQVKAQTGESFESLMGKVINPTAPVSGTVTQVDNEYIYIRPDGEKVSVAGGKTVKVPYEKDFPLASKTYLDHKILVKKGDQVKKGQILGESNFTRGGKLALGSNLRVAYMPYYGANSNDAVVVSEGGAGKLTSERMYKIVVPRDNDLTFNREKHRTYYGHGYTKDQYGPLDSEGVVKPGVKIKSGDPVILGLRKSEMTADDIILGKLHRSLARPFREFKQGWDHDHEGEVIDVVKTPKRIALTIKTRERASVGDKLSGRFGNKGVISQIIPDDQMIADEAGKPLDLIMTSAGVVSRVNPSQLIESAVGKVAEKTGKPILVENFSGRDNVRWAKELLKKHGIKDKETVYDPKTGKKIPGVFAGRQFIMKLFKSTDTNYGARGLGSYDVNLQPTKGGALSAKTLGRMEFDALIGHNARNMLREATAIKSQKNDEYWRALQLGYPTPAPKTTFAADKFLNMLTGAGIRVDRNKNILSLAPLTDADVTKLSAGEIKDAKLVRARDLRPEAGGLFDPAITGGLQGTKWCFRGDTKVITNAGIIKIKEIVEQKLPVKILSYNVETQQLEFQKILHYWENKTKDPLIKLEYDVRGNINGYARSAGFQFLWCTPKHEIYTNKFEKKYAQNMLGHTVFSPTHTLNQVQEQLVYGSLLGDSWLTKPSTNALFECGHVYEQKKYLSLKKEILDLFCKSKLKLHYKKASGKFKARKSWRLRTIQHPIFTEVYSTCYTAGKKKVTRAWLDKIGPLGLAFWFMDDGSAGVYANKLHVTLCTNGFTKKEVKLIVDWLQDTWGIKGSFSCPKEYVNRKDTIGYAISLSTNMGIRFLTIVAPYIVNTMSYKVKFKEPYGLCKKCKKHIDAHYDFCDSCVLKKVATSKTRREYQKSKTKLVDESTIRQRYGSWTKAKNLAQKFEGRPPAEIIPKFDNLRNLCGSKLSSLKNKVTPTYLRKSTIKKIINLGGSSDTRRLKRSVTIYNLEIAKNHNYIANGILVGNSHVNLAEPVISPVFRDPVRRILGMTVSQLNTELKEKGAKHIQKELAKINMDQRLRDLRKSMKKKSGPQLDNDLKQTKYLRALKDLDLTPDKAYVVSKIPVVPPVVRPILPGKGGQEIMYGDINPLYRDLIYINNQFKDVKKNKLLPDEEQNLRPALQEAVGAIYGTNDPVTQKSKARGHKGFLTAIAGTTPKLGYFQSKLVSKTQDVSGRGTIVPDVTLGIDEVGIPEDMLWTMYEKFLVKRLVQNGYNLLGAYPKLVPGKTIRINPFMEPSLSADYDGDAMNVHVPISTEAVKDATNMTLSNMLFSDKARDSLLVFPEMEAIMGLSHATETDDKNTTPKKFKDKGEAMKAYYAGKIGLGTRVKIGKE